MVVCGMKRLLNGKSLKTVIMYGVDLAARMQRSVERMLDRLMDAGRQIQNGHQLEADMRQSLQRAERNVEELTARCDDLEQQLKQETQTREFLSVEFYKADGTSCIYSRHQYICIAPVSRKKIKKGKRSITKVSS